MRGCSESTGEWSVGSGATQVQLIDEQGIGTGLRSVRRTSGYEYTGDCLRGHKANRNEWSV